MRVLTVKSKKNQEKYVCCSLFLIYISTVLPLNFPVIPPPAQKKKTYENQWLEYDSCPVEIQKKTFLAELVTFWSGTSKKSTTTTTTSRAPRVPKVHPPDPPSIHAVTERRSPMGRHWRTWRIIPGLVVRISPPFKAAMKFGHLGSIGPTTPGITIGDDPPRSPRITSQAPRLVGVFF